MSGTRLASWLLVLAVGSVAIDARGADLDDPLAVRTESVEVRFSAEGGVPVAWDVIDPAVLVPERRLRGEDARFPLLLPGVAGTPRWLEVALDPESADIERLVNGSRYVVERIETPAATRISFSSPPLAGLSVRRTYEVPSRGYVARFTLEVFGPPAPARMPSTLGLRIGPGLGPVPVPESGLLGGSYAFVRPAFRDDEGVQQLRELEPGGPVAEFGGDEPIAWVCLHQRYFLGCLIPASPAAAFSQGRAELVAQGSATPLPRLVLDTHVDLTTTRDATLDFELYLGPKDRAALGEAPESLDGIRLAGLWGWFRALCLAVVPVLEMLHAVFRNWGVTLISLALLFRTLLYPLMRSGLRQQARTHADQARLRPEIERIRSEFAKDRGRRDEEILNLYREHGISPFAGLKTLPSLAIQIVVFIALYNVIGEAYELRGARFLWIDDLARPDRLFSLGFEIPVLGSHFNLLPILMAASQVLATRMSSSPEADERQQRNQRRVLVLVAVAFGVLLYSFPSGLVLYWLSSNVVQFFQQQWITRK